MRRLALAALACLIAVACTASSVATSASPSATPRKRTIDAAGVREAVAKRHLLTYKLTYVINGVFEKQAIGGRLVTYQILTLRRIDTTMGNGRDSQAFTLYLDETSIVACRLPFVPPCEQVTPDEAASAALGVVLLDEPLLENPQALDRAELSEDRIAGENVTCFLMRQAGATKLQQTTEVNACYTSEGILMRYGIAAPTFNIELDGLLLNRDVATEDVKLPAGAFNR